MEEKTSSTPARKKSLAGKIVRILFKTVLIIILLFAIIAVLILTPPVQNFIKSKATAWLSNKLQTKVAIGKIYIGFPKKVVLENVYIEDQQKDTLLSGGKLQVDISMLKLLKNQVEVNQVQLYEITAKVKRVLPDTTFNFQFIVDAFAPTDTTTKNNTDTAGMAIAIRDVEFDKIRLVYDDEVTGNDVTLWLEHFDTEIDEFDLDKMRFSVPSTNLSGVRANIYQTKPLVTPEEVTADTAAVAPAPTIDFDFGEFNLKDIQLDYRNDVSALSTKLNLGDLVLEADDVNMKEQVIQLDEFQLNNTTAAITMGKTTQAEVIEEETKQETAQQVNSGWRVTVKNIELNNNNLAFTNDNEPRLKQGMDYAHLDAKGVTFHVDDFVFAPDSIGATITKGQMKEQSGFALNTLRTKFLYSSTKAYLHDLLLETPGTIIRRSIEVSYPSLEAVQKNIGALRMNIDINDSRIQVRDILTFAPDMANQPALQDPSSVIFLTGNIQGSVANMDIETFRLRAFNNTNVALSGKVSGLPDANNVSGDLVIGHIETSRRDIQMLAPKGTLPTNITLPQTIRLSGRLAGSMQSARARINLASDLGNASFNGVISNAADKQRAAYDATLVAQNLQLGVIMQNDTMFGPLTATIAAKGRGFDPKSLNSTVNATINSAVLNKYEYKNVKLNGTMANQRARFDLNINDPNITVALHGNSDLSGKFPSVVLNAVIDSINTRPLNFTADTLMFKGTIAADFPNTDPANLEGNLFVTRSTLSNNGQRYAFDTIAVNSGKSEEGKFLRLRSDVMSFALTGKYNLVQMGSVFQQAIQPYYALSSTPNKDTIEDYDFRFGAEVINGPLLKVFMPTLSQLDPVRIQGRFATGEGFNTSVDAPLIVMGTNRIQQLKINAATNANALAIRTQLGQFSAGPTMNIYSTTLNADIADNKVNFLINLKDAANRNKYRFGGLFEQPAAGSFALKINPDSLMLNYQRWKMAPDNLVRLDSTDVNIRNFTLSQGNQQLSLNSASEARNSPLNVSLSQFRIGTLTAFANQDSLLVDGVINGQAQVNTVMTTPVFTSDLAITDLTFKKDTVGNVTIKVNNTQGNIYAADIRLTGKGNDVAATGNYYVQPAEQSYDMVLDLRKLQVTTLQALSMGSIQKAAGFLSGRFTLEGTFDQPEVNGEINFHDVGFTPVMLGSHFSIDNENIAVVDNKGIHFSTFTIQDESKNKLVLHGDAFTTNFFNYKLNLDLKADNFQALNNTKSDNKLFYGKFLFNTNLHISGTEVSPVVQGNLKINDKTDLTLVMPQSDPGIEEMEGIVRFVDMDSVRMDTTLSIAQADSLNRTDLKGMDISINIEVDKNALLTLIIDQANGDFLQMKGTAQLTGGIDPSGKTTLTGTYEIDEGSYQLSLNMLKRKFEIEKGSKITWLGEPTNADVDLTAVYVANTAPLSLVENTVENIQNLNYYRQKLPFNVKLMLKGELMKPEITFDISLPEEDNLNVDAMVIENVNTRLTQLKSQPSELNKQVFALLLLNRFVQENPFATSGGGGGIGTMARQSVSKLLTEQLNSLASDLISGVDLNFDVASTEDYTTGSMQNRTDLNVSLSKQLLNDRLRVTVGSNFELEGPQQSRQRQTNLAGNVALDYMLSKDGRYLLRAYRKNEFEGEIDGYIIETGLNFILSFDYDHFHDLIRGKKKKEKPPQGNNTDQPAAAVNTPVKKEE
jgi:translocation and assembly module TamB